MDEHRKNTAVARWWAQAAYASYLEGLKKLAAERIPAEDEFDVMAEPAAESSPHDMGYWRSAWESGRLKPDWRQDARAAGVSEQQIDEIAFWLNAWQSGRFESEEHDWRQDARAVGLSDQEIEESWTWYRYNAFAPPPLLAERGEPGAGPMPESVRRILAYNPLHLFLGEDPLIDDLVARFKEPPADLAFQADDWRFWDDIGHALTDPSDADARLALDRLARLVRLKPEHTRDLAERNGTTMEATKRRLIQEAVLLSLGAADERIRIGRRTMVQYDPGHPITLENVFGREGLQELLTLAMRNLESTQDFRNNLERSLGGPFRPAHLVDRAVYRSWLTKEIRRRTTELLGQDLDIQDPGRAGGSRRKHISYDETEPLVDVAEGRLEADTQALTDNRNVRAAGEREDREKALFRTTNYYAGRLQAWEKKDRMELALAHRIDWHRALDQVWREHEAPVIRQYIACVREERLLMDDDLAAARQLGWPEWKVRDVKRRLNGYIGQIAARKRWNSLQANAL